MWDNCTGRAAVEQCNVIPISAGVGQFRFHQNMTDTRLLNKKIQSGPIKVQLLLKITNQKTFYEFLMLPTTQMC